MSVVLLSMQDQEALRFHQDYLNLCSEDERKFYGFGMTRGLYLQYVSFANLHLEGTLNI